MKDIEQEIRNVLALVAATTPIPPAPTASASASSTAQSRIRRSRKRAAVMLMMTIGCCGVGLGAAAATGRLDVHGWWGQPVAGAYNPIPGTERLVTTTVEPSGRIIQLWLADATDRGYCAAFVLPQERPDRDWSGGLCSHGPVGNHWWHTFGGTGGSSGEIFAYRVANAERVVLIQPDRQREDLGVHDGWTVGAVASARGDRPAVLVGYDLGR
jgi:hypothetical protein